MIAGTGTIFVGFTVDSVHYCMPADEHASYKNADLEKRYGRKLVTYLSNYHFSRYRFYFYEKERYRR